MNELHLVRNSGTQTYSALCFFRTYQEKNIRFLALQIKSDSVLQPSNDTNEPQYLPHLEFRVPLSSDLDNNQSFQIQEDPNLSDIYCLEHQSAKKFHLKIIDTSNPQKINISLTASATDPIYYDGSKPDATYEISGIFDLLDKAGTWNIF